MGQRQPVVARVVTRHLDDHGHLHHRTEPALVFDDGRRFWYLHGLQHRDDGPAFIGTGSHRRWYRHGLLHRLDGPAIVLASNTVPGSWVVNGEHVPEAEISLLEELRAAGDLDLLHTVLSLWHPGDKMADLIRAVTAARTPPDCGERPEANLDGDDGGEPRDAGRDNQRLRRRVLGVVQQLVDRLACLPAGVRAGRAPGMPASAGPRRAGPANWSGRTSPSPPTPRSR